MAQAGRGFKREHYHECPECGTTWKHTPEDIVDAEKAHTCPNCKGAQDFWMRGIPFRPMSARKCERAVLHVGARI
jgi:predicted  nucleic acid-binding Zn ribbon protein